MEKYYNRGGCPIHGHVQLSATSKPPVPGIDQDKFNTIAAKVDGNTLIEPELFNFTRQNLTAAVQKVYGSPKYDTPEFAFMQKLMRNSARFAGYKTAMQTKHIKDATKPEQLEAINNSYNSNYMQTEYVHAVRSSRAAKNWQQYEADADLYPALEYMPSTAANPRSEHMKFYGVIKDLNDPFWDTWMPPADWGCQCSVQQRRSTQGSKPEPDNVKLPPKAMRNNPGKTAELFTDGHPMIGKLAKEDRAKIDKEYGHLERKALRNELSELSGSLFNLNGKKIKISSRGLRKTLHDCDISDWPLLREIEDISKEAELVDSRKPLGARDNLNATHFFKIKNHNVFAAIWETDSGEWIFHTLAYKITGEKL